MATPNWSFSYSMTQTPEQNGFTRRIYEPAPTVTLVTSGSPANRRIQVDTTSGGSLVCLTSNVPALDSQTGMTAEGVINVAGAGDVGFEVTFLDLQIGLNIFSNKVLLDLIGNPIEVATASNNADILWRVTYGNNAINVYRAGALVIGPQAPTLHTRAFQRFLFWFEGGGTGIIKSMNYFLGGAVAP